MLLRNVFLILACLISGILCRMEDYNSVDEAIRCPDLYGSIGGKPFRKCPIGTVAAPLPQACQQSPSDDEVTTVMPFFNCVPVENLLKPSQGISASFNGRSTSIKDDLLIEGCDELISTKSSDHWRIEFPVLQNFYAILISRALGTDPSNHGLQVKVARNISSSEMLSSDCEYHPGHHNTDFYYTFYCYHHPMALTSSSQIGVDSHIIDIFGKVPVDYAVRNLSELFKVYPYPVKVCGTPELYANQSVSPLQEFYLTGQSVTYRCLDKELVLDGNPTRTCKWNGLWSEQPPICAKIKPFRPWTFVSSYAGNEYPRKTTSGSSSRQMLIPNQQITYEFDNTSLCIQYVQFKFHLGEFGITVHSADPSVPWQTNSSSAFERRIHYFMDKERKGHFFSCASNITISRFANSLTDNHVEIVEQVLIFGYPRAKRDICPNRTLENLNIKQVTTDDESTVYLECNNGFKPSGLNLADHPKINAQWKSRCEHGKWKIKTGLWNASVPSCQRNYCPVPSAIENGIWRYTTLNELHTIEYKCSLGYEMEGNDTAACENGQWNSEPPSCKITFCPVLDLPVNSVVVLNNGGNKVDANDLIDQEIYQHGMKLEFSCLPGFNLIGNSTLTCNSKTWSSDPPKCEEILCKSPEYLRNMKEVLSSSSDNTWKLGSHTFQCLEGFHLEGHDEKQTIIHLSCQENGHWEKSMDYYYSICVETETGWPTGLVAGLAILLALIVVLITISIFLVLKRKNRKRERNIDGGYCENSMTQNEEVLLKSSE